MREFPRGKEENGERQKRSKINEIFFAERINAFIFVVPNKWGMQAERRA
jgi:hypothetical protein